MSERYIYRGLTPFTLGLIPARSKTVTDGAGNIRVGAPSKSVKIVFTDGTFEVNETTAKTYIKPNGKPFTVKELKRELEGHVCYPSKYQKIFDSTQETTKEQIAYAKLAEESNTKRRVQTTKGVRAKKG